MAGKPKPCTICGTPHTRGKDWCLKCANERAKAKSILIREANHIKKVLLVERGELCQECNTETATIVHHITGLANGGTNDHDNLLLVCWNCHGNIHGWNQD